LLFGKSFPRYIQNVANIAVVVAFAAQIAHFPLNWQAEVRERGAELAFCVGEMLG